MRHLTLTSETSPRIEKRIDALGYSGEMINLGIRLEGLSAGLRDLVTKQAPLSDRGELHASYMAV